MSNGILHFSKFNMKLLKLGDHILQFKTVSRMIFQSQFDSRSRLAGYIDILINTEKTVTYINKANV